MNIDDKDYVPTREEHWLAIVDLIRGFLKYNTAEELLGLVNADEDVLKEILNTIEEAQG